MSIALERGREIGRSGFVRGVTCISVYEAEPPLPGAAETSSSSSIGKNSDCSAAGSGSDGEEGEVQSLYKGPLDVMDALEESLPMRRGISRFYCGKSKSFTYLGDVSSSPSAKDLSKPENAYSRKRKNLLSLSIMCDKPRKEQLIAMEGGIAKRLTNSSRSTTIPIGRCSSGSIGDSSEEEHEPSRVLPPLHPHGKPHTTAAVASPLSSSPLHISSIPARSFSMMDLRVTSSSCSFAPMDKNKRTQ
ncbi:uncharacterized protein [Typha angustifolia]|uniref:uncharacterized protein n=1 Tax=Typha angustifolia TaxID=59011 RepID=UPI003C306219